MYLIAEIGVNHGGLVAVAEMMIHEAKAAGADAVKFQLFSAVELGRPEIKQYELSQDEIRTLAACAEAAEIDFLCTPFHPWAVHFLSSNHLVKRMKLGSGVLFDDALLDAARSLTMPVLLSTGMGTMDEIRRALEKIGHRNVMLLHCVSEYPCALEHANLRAIIALRAQFGLEVGYSDHTACPVACAAAAALGARVIEAHFTLDRNADGPDHTSSFEPAAFASMAATVRAIPAMLGDGEKRLHEHEAAVRRVWA